MDRTIAGSARKSPAAHAVTSVVLGIALAILIVGGLNWGLYGLWAFDLVAWLFGPLTAATRVVYVLVGVAALVSLCLFARLRPPAASRNDLP